MTIFFESSVNPDPEDEDCKSGTTVGMSDVEAYVELSVVWVPSMTVTKAVV
jgi:hypothetical protein